MRRRLLFVTVLLTASATTGCRDQTVGDRYPVVFEIDGRPLLPAAGRSYDARILEGTAQAIGLEGGDGVPAAGSRSRRPGGGDGGEGEGEGEGEGDGDFGSIRDAFREFNEAAKKALSSQPGTDSRGSDPESGSGQP